MNSTLSLSLAVLSLSAPVPKDLAPPSPAPFAVKTSAPGRDGVTVGIKTRVPSGQAIFVIGGPNGQRREVVDTFEVKTVQAALSQIDGLKIYTPEGEELD